MTNQSDKVVYLAYRSPEQVDGEMCFMACAHCRNKTFTHTWTGDDQFPLVRCSACGKHMGRVGWANNEDDDD